MTIDNSVHYLAEHYERIYCRYKHDSPNKSRERIARDIRDRLTDAAISPARILELGSGPQALLKYLRSFAKEQLKDIQYITADIASIDPSRLLVTKALLANAILDPNYPYKSKVIHMQINGAQLPFADESIGLVVSNMALDFMPPQAVAECARILPQGGAALFNLHHPSMITDTGIAAAEPSVKKFWQYLKDNRVLFEYPDQITERFTIYGLRPQKIEEQTDGKDTWWHVELQKNVLH